MKLPPDLAADILARASHVGPTANIPEEGEVETNRYGKGTGNPGRQKSVKRQRRDDLTPEQNLFLAACQAHGLPEPVPEYRFHPTRRWRFDWLFLDWLTVEIQGGLFTGGRHVRGAALVREYEKINEGVILGYSTLLVTPDQVKDGSAFELVKRALETT